MTTHAFGDALDVDWRGGDEKASIEGRAVGMLGPFLDFDDGLDAGEPRLARIAACRCYPIDILRGGVGPCLDAAMALLDRGFADQFFFGRGAKVVRHIGLERWLVALEREQVIGLA